MDVAISPIDFYGLPSVRQLKIEKILKNKPIKMIPKLPPYLSSILGPSRTWKIFSRQQEAINFANSRKGNLMAFAFQHGQGTRSFLVCHPLMLYFVSSQRSQSERCTYEIIQESMPSKLYLDIEFEYEYNKDKNPQQMLQSVLTIICHKLLDSFQIQCSRYNILDLDSSTDKKFSRHIIFQLRNKAFEDNYAVGCFVKDVCRELTDAFCDPRLMDSVCKKYNVLNSHIQELFVNDKKGLKKLFIDNSVYSKNRHFRLMGSTKLNKNSPLVISSENLFKPDNMEEYSLFLASLVTLFEESFDLLTYGTTLQLKKFTPTSDAANSAYTVKSITEFSPLDGLIQQIIQPKGRIRRKWAADGAITFEIVGYRYCGNIEREHRSNNIKIVVDTNHCTYYQTCYDLDCRGYRSESKPLPAELQFKLAEEPMLLEIADNLISDDQLLELMQGGSDEVFLQDGNNNCDMPEEFSAEDDEALLNVSLGNSPTKREIVTGSGNFETAGLSDAELIDAVDAIEMCMDL